MSEGKKPAKRKPAPTFDPTATKQAAAVKAKKKTSGKMKPKAEPENPPAVAGMAEMMDPPFPVFFEAGKRSGAFYYLDGNGRWNPHGVEDFRRKLRFFGIGGRTEEGSLVSLHDRIIMKVQTDCVVDYAGPLAGHYAGAKSLNGTRLLVTCSPSLPQPVAGDFPTLNKFLSELLGVGQDAYGERQVLVFALWLARAWRAIATERSLLGQALILAGPSRCGKNLLQEVIITTCLGSRAVKAGDYLLGRTEFSGYLFAGEHLMLSDEQADRDIRSRRAFGQRIKDTVANTLHSMHPKGKDPISMEARWRVSISVNDEAEHLQTLPPVADRDIRDKVHLLRCWPASIPVDEEEKHEWLARIRAEVPAFLAHALALQVPPELMEASAARFGHREFHHPELLQRLNSFSPELHLLQLVDQLLFEPWTEPEPWTGNATDLRSKLIDAAADMPVVQREVSDLLRSAEQTGQYLARLLDHHPERVKELPRTGNKRRWQIVPPVEEVTP